jgi:hypothetical protein
MNAVPIAALIARDATAKHVRSALPGAPVVDAEPVRTHGRVRLPRVLRLRWLANWLARGQIGPAAGVRY